MPVDDIQICQLCVQPRELRRSHILPEFLYLPTYDEKHRAIEVKSEEGAKERFHQKGLREFLLCDECEAGLSIYEGYAAPIVKSLQNLEIRPTGDIYAVSDVEYSLFKLFQMSLLWRTSVASEDMFSGIDLGSHEPQLRQMLHNEQPGEPDQYGCAMFLLEDSKYAHTMIWSPVSDAIDGHTCFRFQTGRLFWFFFLPSDSPNGADKLFLSPEFGLRVLKAPWPEEVVLRRLAGKILEARSRLD